MKLRTVVAFSIFWAIHVLCWPLLVLGYVVFVAKLIAYSRRFRRIGHGARVSLHPLDAAQAGTRRDEPAARLMMVMPSVPHLGCTS